MALTRAAAAALAGPPCAGSAATAAAVAAGGAVAGSAGCGLPAQPVTRRARRTSGPAPSAGRIMGGLSQSAPSQLRAQQAGDALAQPLAPRASPPLLDRHAV